MEFFGPWFYERQYFHSPVNTGISNDFRLGLIAQGHINTIRRIPRPPKCPGSPYELQSEARCWANEAGSTHKEVRAEAKN